MIRQKLLRILSILLLVLAVVIGLLSIQHPIILKWVTGRASHHGAAMPAIVFANGEKTNAIKVYYTDQDNNYLVSFAAYDSAGSLQFINIDLNNKQISEAAVKDHDLIAGHLFQGKTAVLTPIPFDPQLTYSDAQIRFKLYSKAMKIDSVRIVLP